MAFALIIGRNEQDRNRFGYFLQNVPKILASLHPGLDLRVYPDLGDYNEIDFILAWRAPFGIFNQFPRLKAIASLGAGVDHLFADPDLPHNVPIVRIVDPAMSIEITQYVVATVLYWSKRFDLWAENQAQKIWGGGPPFNFSNQTVGIMGLGFLGQHAAKTLHSLGIKVVGWSQSPKNLMGIRCFAETELSAFLSEVSALVCQLPLTPATKHILNAKNFAQLRRGAYVINLGRGEHLVEADLLAALASGQLSGACLDVFSEEPLPPSHPFWTHPRIRITPHIASVTNLATALPQILENYRHAMAGESLLNLADIKKGY